LEIWETPEKLEEERELREQKKEKSKVKKFNKQVKSKKYSEILFHKICPFKRICFKI